MIKAQLLDYFMTTERSDTDHLNEVVQTLSMTDEEIEAQGERLCVLVSIPAPVRERNNMERTQDQMDRDSEAFHNAPAETSTAESGATHQRPYRRHQTPFRTGDTRGTSSGRTRGFTRYNIPEEYQPLKKYSVSHDLNLDCVTIYKYSYEHCVHNIPLMTK